MKSFRDLETDLSDLGKVKEAREVYELDLTKIPMTPRGWKFLLIVVQFVATHSFTYGPISVKKEFYDALPDDQKKFIKVKTNQDE